MISINTLKEDSMSNIDFPNTPSNGDTYSFDGKQWTYDGEKWETSGGSKGQKGEPGPGAGDKGAKGEPGVGGSTGPSGNKGEKGESGPQGAVGPQGSSGAQGPAGSTGPQGTKGEAGPTGDKGATGSAGPQGNAGATGPTGSSGDKGDKGEVGAGTNQTLTLNSTAGQLAISDGNNVDLRQTQYLYSSTSDLPSASTYHGAIAHVHAEGALYYAHGGSWVKLANDSTAVNSSSEVTFTRDVHFQRGVEERFGSLSGQSGTVTHNLNDGHVFYHTTPAGDFTANFTNFNLDDGYTTSITIIVNQGVTARVVSAVQIEGSAQTINWQGGSAPTGTANGIDAFSFTILRNGSSYIVLGQMVDFT